MRTCSRWRPRATSTGRARVDARRRPERLAARRHPADALRHRLPSEKATPAVAFCFALNHLLDAEPWARERLAGFAGESVEVHAPLLPALRLTILPGGRVEAGGGEPALVLTLQPEALAVLARGGEHFMRSVEV